jgi:hypothetical protein
MGEREDYQAREAAKQELTRHPERSWRHQDAIRIYLAGFAYAESAVPADRPAQPVDEPAPPENDDRPAR